METATIQEQKNITRISVQRRAANLLYVFAQKGFKSFNALKTICAFYDSTITYDEIKQFWQLSYLITDAVCDKIEVVLEQLKEAK